MSDTTTDKKFTNAELTQQVAELRADVEKMRGSQTEKSGGKNDARLEKIETVLTQLTGHRL